jgi:hypothetical protein
MFVGHHHGNRSLGRHMSIRKGNTETIFYRILRVFNCGLEWIGSGNISVTKVINLLVGTTRYFLGQLNTITTSRKIMSVI